MSNPAIAVIGMGCWYPGAHNLPQLWENILARRIQFRRIPQQRLPLSEYYDPDPTLAEKTYANRAAVIDGFKFDWIGKHIPKQTVESADIVHWLALEVALSALENAGYTRKNVVTKRSGVVLGNTLTGEQMRSNVMRLRWPYVQKAMRAAAEARGLPSQLLNELIETTEEYYKSAFPTITEDSLAGCLSNTIAGRICNFLNFNGGGYVVDGACSASLIAIATAATALVNHDLDLALAGGVDVSLDPFEIVGFAKMGAITARDMTVYDKKASGFIPGEGCGFVVLKRLEDARRDDNYVYAVLRGWGISSDGRGGVTAPKAEGQAIALLQAYDRAGYNIRNLNLIEGHGTGTPVGDRAELEAIGLAMAADGEITKRSCGITSFKSIVGHTKAAAGVGGFIKAVMAVNSRILPPTASCKEPNQVFETSASCIYPILQGEIRSQTETLRAGVSAMGFGGINCHVTLESGDRPSVCLATSIEERALLVSKQDTELFVLGAESTLGLRRRTQAVISLAEGISVAELTDLAAHLTQELDLKFPVRAAIIADTPDELIDSLQQLEKMLSNKPPAKGEIAISLQKNIWLGNTVSRRRIGFLFPGQGSGQLNMGRTLVERYSCASGLVKQADGWLQEMGAQAISQFIFRPLDRAVNAEQIQEWSTALTQTQVAQPAICLTSLLWTRRLANLGIKPVAVAGHSLGELTAFRVAGAFDDKNLLNLATVRGQAMSTSKNDAGTMVSLACSHQAAVKLLQQVSGYAVVANINSPKQVVISGDRPSIQQVIQLAADHGIQTYQLPVSHAFHSQLVSGAVEHLQNHASVPENLGEITIQLFSSVDGQQVQPGLKLREHFAHQVTAQVNFVALVGKLAQSCDLIIEVGPGKVLSGLVKDIFEPSSFLCLPVESKPGMDRDLNTVLASLFIHGSEINWEALYEKRLVRPFIPASNRVFIENPCEHPFQVSAVTPSRTILPSQDRVESMVADGSNVSPQVVSQVLFDYLSQRGKFLAEVVRADMQNLPSLNNGAVKDYHQAQISPVSVEPKLKTKVETSNSHNKTEAIEELLLNQVAQRTGYPRENIVLEARLLDDLNLDSIKAGDLIATLAKECNIAGKIDPATLANATLQEIALVIRAAIANNQEAIAPELTVSTQALNLPASIPNLLLKLVEERTGFPRETLSMNLRLLNDLNLDSIKAGELVAEAAKRVQVPGRLDPSQFANATLTEIANALQKLDSEASTLEHSQPNVPQAPKSSTKPSTLASLGQKSWARNFNIEYAIEEAQANLNDSQQNHWKTANVLIFCTPEQGTVAEALQKELQSRGAQVHVKVFAEANEALINNIDCSHFIAFLPQVTSDQLSADVNLEEIIRRLHTVATLTPVISEPHKPTTLAFIQFGGGYFGKQPQVANIEQCCATAFAASIHVERPNLKVRVIDFSTEINPALLAKHLIYELSTPEIYTAVGYDCELTRRIPRPVLQHPASYATRTISWSTDDVILVIGGAKGITATCALAFAQATGVRMALVGSSPQPQGEDNEIASTLESFNNAGLTCQYYQCDITHAEAAIALIHQIRQEMGNITGMIHGAGLNKARRVEQVSVQAARAEVAPKVLGALNLCNALQDNPPKLFVGFGSIIGIIGVPGNAWYAFSNEALDMILRRFEAEHPETSVLTIAFTDWEEVGMAERMGSIPALVKLGLYPISKEEGVRRFLKLMLSDPGDRQVAVVGRIKYDTWLPKLPSVPSASRFLEQIIHVEPGVEVISRVHLSIEKDVYTQDHIYKGSYLFPTVFGLEAMAQVIAYATGQSHFSALRIEDIRLERPIVVDSVEGVDIEIHAEVIEDWSAGAKQRVRAGIRTEQTGFAIDHFSATFVLNIDSNLPKVTVELPETPLDIQPQQDLYSWLLFQGLRFQRLQEIYTLNANQCVFSTEIRASSLTGKDSFAGKISSPLLLGDPFSRDSLLQAVQLIIPQDISLPIRIDSIELYQLDKNVSHKAIAVATLEGRDGQQYSSTVFAFNKDGQMIEKLEGYQLRILEHREDHPTAQELAQPSQRDEQILCTQLTHWAEQFQLAVPEVSLVYLPGLHELSRAERHQRELPVFSRAIAKLLNTNK
ncbi:MAG: SDR family NAD(P)-dependent oxidoreductase [Pelatocladus maniniholoensis HA4357-MV3]|jgi:enediyne polyketide synthase|uniref:SDR family NAD(P)-dependent oxidoreductase n=1 Tax=Pelatocladus maniniholoensis HA4357-MV3 TaxID=1117104 RepID=A0A9E3HDK6_9NOST|nr:SDR family NAD(P)-dependent oxidoreductase [Pelatocladus maniniholoensis HA4357-MV3]